jgi:uncharacterized protein (DUF2147 family)
MFKSSLAAIFAIASLASSAAQAQPAQTFGGIWRVDDGSATVRVSRCPASATWCAIVIGEQLKPGEPSKLNQTIVRDMRPKGTQTWIGQYVVDGQTMKAMAKLPRPNMLTFRICAFDFLCDTVRLNRVGP